MSQVPQPDDSSPSGQTDLRALSDEQRRLVMDNLGLIGVHIRRHVPRIYAPRREREWEDLFQEGCLGLIRAAADFEEERGIPFASFALPRIHTAVSRALHGKFTLVSVPRSRRSRGKDPTERPESFPVVEEFRDPRRHRYRSRPDERHEPFSTRRQTVAERLREKYERAVRTAGRIVADESRARGVTRGDRKELVHTLAEDRFLVPRKESRKALRQIARETRSSYGRVAEAERLMSVALQKLLADDPEVQLLRRWARSSSGGTASVVGAEVESMLKETGVAELLRRFRAAGAADRAAMLRSLHNMAPADLERKLRTVLALLPGISREQLLQQTAGAARKGGEKQPQAACQPE